MRFQLPLLLAVALLALPASAIAQPPAEPTAPRNVTPPSITGAAREGETLGLRVGEWSGTDPISYSFAWNSCIGTACRQLATTETYRVSPADVGRTIVLVVFARNAAGSTTAFASAGVAKGRSAGLARLSPFPTLLVDGRVSGAVTRISTLRLRRVPGGATVNLSCAGRGCPFRTSRVRVPKGKSRTVDLRRLQRRMRAGTTVVITVRKGDTLGKYVRLRFRRGSVPARVDRCVAPNSPKPQPCP